MLPAGPVSAHPSVDEDIAAATARIRAGRGGAPEFLRRGELHRIAGQWEAARLDYERASALDASVAGLDLCHAALAFDTGRYATALEAVDRDLDREPGHPEALHLRGRILAALGRPVEGAGDLDRAIAGLAAPSPDLYVERARLLAAAGRRREALEALDRGIERLGPVAGLELPAIQIELERGSFEAANARLDRLAATMERPEALLARRAEILKAAGEGEAARLAMAAAGAARERVETASAAAAPPASRAADRGGTAGIRPASARPAAGTVDPIVTRGPYLQDVGQTRATIRWRTDMPCDSRVRIGTEVGSLGTLVDDAALTTEHEIAVTTLAPGTRYYYAVGTTGADLEGDDADHAFSTSPDADDRGPVRLWILGDSGTANADAAAVRDAWTAYNGGAPADLMLMLGDNAYSTGMDAEYQAAVFDMYAAQLRNTPLWPTRGNHDVLHAPPASDYYDIFTLPTLGEAGGVTSMSEAYYSFDYGDIHFICLDSEGSDRTPGGSMALWLQTDLVANTRHWVIAFWHHPPYTKGSHDSDNDSDSGGKMKDMRTSILPILDAAGVDLVLTGHSHSYERSCLLDGHYDYSWTLTPEMQIDPGDGREGGDGEYRKPSLGMAPHEGTVHAVAGSSGQISGGALDHPVMVASINSLGSLVVDIEGYRLKARFLDNLGAIADSFTILKGPDAVAVASEPPSGARRLAAAPNPFADQARIAYVLDRPGPVKLVVLDAAGRRVRTLAEGARAAGRHSVAWDGRDDVGRARPPGVYFAVLEADGRIRAHKLVRLGS